MARIPRRAILEDKSYFHITWKCHNDSFLLKDGRAKSYLYDLLLRYKKKYHVKIYGYCFMDNHPHIVGYCESVEALSRFFQVVNGSFARFVNKDLERKGQVVMDRFKSPRIESERYMLNVLHYVDLNPVRAGVCRRAKDYKWSSYRARLEGKEDPLLDPLPDGIRITPSDYFSNAQYFLNHSEGSFHIHSNTYFIGTPLWVKTKRKEMFEAILKARSQRAVVS